MGRRRSKPEELIARLREVKGHMRRSETIAHAIGAIGISAQTYTFLDGSPVTRRNVETSARIRCKHLFGVSWPHD